MPRLLRPLIARSTWRGWTYFVLGGALLTPYLIAAMVVSGVVPRSAPWLVHLTFSLAAVVVPIAVTGLVPAVRAMEGTAAKELLGAPETVGEGRSWPARLRTSAWFTGHLLAGGVIGLLSLGLPAFTGWLAVVQIQGPARLAKKAGHHEEPNSLVTSIHGWTGTLLLIAGLVALVGFVYALAAVAAVARRLATIALGLSSAERIAEVERRADRLAERNRLARELHDSVGHALSIVTVQAGAANRVLEADPAFVRTALTAIEESARGALEDLDHVLGLLREETPSATAPQRTLRDLDDLLRKTGMKVDARFDGDPGRLPAAVSREAYRIVQEGLTNALKHAGDVPVTLRLAVREELLELEMINPLRMPGRGRHAGAAEGAGNGARRPGGGRGLTGIRERVGVLRGRLAAGPQEGQWRVAATIPLTRSGHQ